MLQNLKLYHRVHKSSPLFRILRQLNPVHAFTSCFCKAHLFFQLTVVCGLKSICHENAVSLDAEAMS